MTEKYIYQLKLSATELSLLKQGVDALVKEQEKAIIASQEPYLRTLRSHLKMLKALQKKFGEINSDIEDEVIKDIKAYTITTEKGTISIPFPQKKFRAYLKNVHATTRKKLTKEQVQKIFLMAIEDFYKGLLSLDELSSIAEAIYYPNMPILDKDLDPVLDEASELSYTVRQVDNSSPQVRVEGFGGVLTSVRVYYEKYRHLLSE